MEILNSNSNNTQPVFFSVVDGNSWEFYINKCSVLGDTQLKTRVHNQPLHFEAFER